MDWNAYLYGFAEHAAKKSKDATQVGAVLVAPNGRSVLLTAYNGPPPGVRDLPERRERPEKYRYVCHAERNLIATAARHGIRTEGTTVYCTHRCCSPCAAEMIAAGVSSFVYGPGRFVGDVDQWEASATMFEEAGVKTGEMVGTYVAKPSADSDSEWCERALGLLRSLAPYRILTTTDEAEILAALELREEPVKTVLRILKARP